MKLLSVNTKGESMSELDDLRERYQTMHIAQLALFQRDYRPEEYEVEYRSIIEEVLTTRAKEIVQHRQGVREETSGKRPSFRVLARHAWASWGMREERCLKTRACMFLVMQILSSSILWLCCYIPFTRAASDLWMYGSWFGGIGLLVSSMLLTRHCAKMGFRSGVKQGLSRPLSAVVLAVGLLFTNPFQLRTDPSEALALTIPWVLFLIVGAVTLMQLLLWVSINSAHPVEE
jgi:hypothetical protein